MRVQFYWTQRFPAGKTVELTQTYRPVVGGTYYVPNNDDRFKRQPYCGGADALLRIEQLHPAKSPTEFERRIQYILTTANNWDGPIRHFKLSLVTDSPDDIVMTCMPDLKKVSSTRYELDHSDFHPDRELELFIFQAEK
jgi:hypothetical protein